MAIKDFLNLPEEEQILEANISGMFIDAIDWNTAKRLQMECDPHLFYDHITAYWLAEINKRGKSWSWFFLFNWLLSEALPQHYIAAAMAAKGLSNEE